MSSSQRVLSAAKSEYGSSERLKISSLSEVVVVQHARTVTSEITGTSDPREEIQPVFFLVPLIPKRISLGDG